MSEERKSEIVIIAPHYDDEIIGCSSILMNPITKPIIVYLQDDEKRKKEALKLKNYINNIQVQLFQKSIPSIFLNPSNVLYFPDFYFETHPDHRKWGAVGEDLLRQGFKVVFYSINMQTPFIFEVKEPILKKNLLDKVYPSQRNLWKFDAKYYLFEGYYNFFN